MKIESFEQACQLLKLSTTIPDGPKWLKAAYQLGIIATASRENVEVDWSNYKQPKWFVWWDMEHFSLRYVYDRYSVSSVPPPFVFLNKEDAKHCVKTFPEVWKDYFSNEW